MIIGKLKLLIDHDHETGKIRGLLCHRCNTGLGFFLDNPHFLTNAAFYLEKNKCPSKVERPKKPSPLTSEQRLHMENLKNKLSQLLSLKLEMVKRDKNL